MRVNAAGHVVEQVTGKVWDTALREQIIEPLGLTHTCTLPEEVLRFRAAMGHHNGAPAPVWGLMRSGGPAGLICARAADVVAFAAAHLGNTLLAAPQVMWEPQVDVPNPYSTGRQWGLGWVVDRWDGRLVLSHGGNTIGQSAKLWLLPDTGTAVCALANGGHTSAFLHTVATELLGELTGVTVPAPLGPPAEPYETDVARYAGVYEREGNRLTLTVRDGRLHLHDEITGALAGLQEPTEMDLVPVNDTTFVGRLEGRPMWMSAVFYELPDGRPYLHLAARATPKVSD